MKAVQVTKSIPQQQRPQLLVIQQENTQQPIRLEIDSPTDWPVVIATIVVGITSVVASGIVAFISRQTQRAQVRSSVASLRSAWIVELRMLAANFIGLATRAGRGFQESSRHFETPEGRKEISELWQSASQIELMLDPEKDSTKSIVKIMKETIASIQREDFAQASTLLNSLKSELSRILEQAWNDIKEDLRNPGRSLEADRN